MLKKILIATTLLLLFLGLFGGTTAIQLFPFIIFYALCYLEMKEKKNVNFWIVFLAVIMTLINFSGPFYIDIITWVLIAIAWWKK